MLKLTDFETCNFLIWADEWLSRTSDEVVSVLGSCPSLNHLEMSLRSPRYCSLLRHICMKYHEQGYSPLQLETLKLGSGMTLLSKDRNGDADYLRHLVRTECLTKLHMTSHGIPDWRKVPRDIVNSDNMAWGTVSQQNTPSLVYLIIDQIDQAGCEYLLSDGISALLSNIHLEIEDHFVRVEEDQLEDQEDGQEDGQLEDQEKEEYSIAVNPAKKIFCLNDLFSEKVERPPQAKSLTIVVLDSAYDKKAPMCWMKTETLSLKSIVPYYEPSIFTGFADRFLSPDAFIQDLKLELTMGRRMRHLMTHLRHSILKNLQDSVLERAQTCKKLRTIRVTFLDWQD